MSQVIKDQTVHKKDKKVKSNIHQNSLSVLNVIDEVENDKLYIDSGASTHMTSRLDWMVNVKGYSSGKVTIAKGEESSCQGVGDIPMITIRRNKNNIKTIKDVVHVPYLNSKLLSVKKAEDKGFFVVFNKTGSKFYDSNNYNFLCTGDILLHGSIHDVLYTVGSVENKLPREFIICLCAL